MIPPLGCSLEFVETLAPDAFGRLRMLDEFDMSFLRPKLIEKSEGLIRPETTDLAIRELKRFLSIPTLLFPDTIVVPSAQVDAAWHQLILFTPTYRDFCREVLGREYLDHRPVTPTNPVDDSGFALTLNRYRQAYGESPPEMWAPVPSCAGGVPRNPPVALAVPLAALFAALFASLAALSALLARRR